MNHEYELRKRWIARAKKRAYEGCYSELDLYLLHAFLTGRHDMFKEKGWREFHQAMFRKVWEVMTDIDECEALAGSPLLKFICEALDKTDNGEPQNPGERPTSKS